jgi:hypothetical protein
MEDFQARFMPRFIATARSRLDKARDLLERGEAKALASELHALAGEARMLSQDGIADDALSGEAAARSWPGADGEARSTCARCLDGMGKTLASLSAPSQTVPLGDPK